MASQRMNFLCGRRNLKLYFPRRTGSGRDGAVVFSRTLARAALIVLALLALQFARPTLAQTSSWNGGTGNWSVPGNWTAGVPNSSTAIASISVIPSAVTLDQDATVLGLSLGPSDSLTVGSGFALSVVSKSGFLESSGTLVNNGTITGVAASGGVPAFEANINNASGVIRGEFQLNGAATITGGILASDNFSVGSFGANLNGVQIGTSTFTTFFASGELDLEGAVTNVGTLQLGNTAALSGTSLQNTGTIDAFGAASLFNLTVTNTGGLVSTEPGGTLTLDGATITGGVVAGNIAALHGGGVDTVQLGTTTVGTTLSAGSNLVISNTVTNSNDLFLGNGSQLSGSGRIVNNGAIASLSSESATISVGVNNSGGIIFTKPGGTLTFDGINIGGGTVEGQIIAANGARLTNVSIGQTIADNTTLLSGTLGIADTVGGVVLNNGVLTLGNGSTGATLLSLNTTQFIAGHLVITPGTIVNNGSILGGGNLDVPILNQGLIFASNPNVPLVLSGTISNPNLTGSVGGTFFTALTLNNVTVNANSFGIKEGTFNGVGTIVIDQPGSAFTNVGGKVTPGLDAPGTLSLIGNYSQTAITGSTPVPGSIDFLLGGGQSGQYSAFDISGFATFDQGSVLQAEFFNGFDPSADCPTAFGLCDTFDVLDSSGLFRTGGFSLLGGDIVYDLPTLPVGLSWEEVQTPDDIELKIFGSSGGTGGSATPEPGSLLLFGTGLCGMGFLVRKRFTRAS